MFVSFCLIAKYPWVLNKLSLNCGIGPGSPFGAKPFPKPMMTWHHLCKYATTTTIRTTTKSRKANDINIYFYTNSCHLQRPHILNVHLSIDNAHVFSGSTVNPGARTGHHSDIVTPLAHGCERCDWSTFLGAVPSLKPHGEKCIFQQVFFSFYAYWHGIIFKITEMYWAVFVLLVCKVL